MSLKDTLKNNIFNLTGQVKRAVDQGRDAAAEKLADGQQIATTKIQRGKGIAARRRDMTRTQVMDLKELAAERGHDLAERGHGVMNRGREFADHGHQMVVRGRQEVGELSDDVYRVSQNTMKKIQKLDRKARRLERRIRRIEKQKMKLLRK